MLDAFSIQGWLHVLDNDRPGSLAFLFAGLNLLQAADVATGVSTVATSLSSAAVSLAGPFLRQASKQVLYRRGDER